MWNQLYDKFSFLPEQGSRFAEQVDYLFFALVGISLFFVVAISAFIFIFSVKYRRRAGNEVAQATEESAALEIIWSVIPLVLAIGLFAWGAKLFLELYNPPPEESLEIFVTGKQWMWKFQHPDGRREINNLHVPVGRPVKLTMISQDVIHSFYLPVLRIKHDVLPMRYTTTWFNASTPGTSRLFCAEYCGTEHSRMVGLLHLMPPQDYQAWLASPLIEGGDSRDGALASGGAAAAPTSDADKGKALLEAQGCRACHRVEDALIAPKLEGIYGTKQPLVAGEVTVDDNYIRESILTPTAKVVRGYTPVMPPFQGRISEEEIRLIIAYIRSSSGK